MIRWRGAPADWVCDHGKPARAVGKAGMPSYESADGKLVVLDALVVQMQENGTIMFFPGWYGSVALLAPDGLAPLYHQERAVWQWRPLLWRYGGLHGEVMRLGSELELGWRHGLMEIQHILHGGVPREEGWTHDRAEKKARELLIGSLSPQQRLEFAASGDGWFRVRGGKTGNMYRVENGNGFSIVDHYTGEKVVSYCLHPDYWMPIEDVSLATKLALEDPELEVECLENARIGYTLSPSVLSPFGRRQADHARRLERDLIPDNRELVVA